MAVLVGILVAVGQGVDVVGLAQLVGGAGLRDVLHALVVAHEARYHDLAGGLLAHAAHQARLEPEHGERDVGLEAGALRHAGGGVDSAGHVDADEGAVEVVVHRLDPHVEGLAHGAPETRAEHRVYHDVGLHEQGHKLIVLGRDVRGGACRDRPLGGPAGGVRAHEGGPDRGGHVNLHAMAREVLGGDPAVAGVVARTGEHHDGALVVGAHRLHGHDGAGAAHELG